MGRMQELNGENSQAYYRLMNTYQQEKETAITLYHDLKELIPDNVFQASNSSEYVDFRIKYAFLHKLITRDEYRILKDNRIYLLEDAQ